MEIGGGNNDVSGRQTGRATARPKQAITACCAVNRDCEWPHTLTATRLVKRRPSWHSDDASAGDPKLFVIRTTAGSPLES